MDEKIARYSKYLARVENIVRDVLAMRKIKDSLYVDGTQRIRYYASSVETNRQLTIEDLVTPERIDQREYAFENALLQKLLHPRNFNLIALIGGLGAGKSTTVDFILRRFHENSKSIQETCPCPCRTCAREPIRLDFTHLGQPPIPTRSETVTTIFRTIRVDVYQRLIEEWLSHIGVDPTKILGFDPKFIVLRRLLIVNDLMLWEGPEHPQFVKLDYSPLRLQAPLFSLSPTISGLKNLVRTYQNHARDFDQILQEELSNERKSQLFMSYLLQFYVHRCHPNNPKSLIIIDNIDQLPSGHIEHFARQLHDVASRVSGLPVLLPLRPSSLNLLGFPTDIGATFHYGPNNFEMILRRLEYSVLSRSRRSLMGLEDDKRPTIFSTDTEELELRAFLFATYFYARVMASPIPESELHLHDDHQFLLRLELPEDSLADLAETADALVGTCCRYAFDLMKRYYRNIYRRPTLLRQAQRKMALGIEGIPLTVDFPLMIEAFLRQPPGSERNAPRVANLFRPPLNGERGLAVTLQAADPWRVE